MTVTYVLFMCLMFYLLLYHTQSPLSFLYIHCLSLRHEVSKSEICKLHGFKQREHGLPSRIPTTVSASSAPPSFSFPSSLKFRDSCICFHRKSFSFQICTFFLCIFLNICKFTDQITRTRTPTMGARGFSLSWSSFSAWLTLPISTVSLLD